MPTLFDMYGIGDVAPTPQAMAKRTWGQAGADTLRAAASGIGGLIKSGGELYGLATGDMDNAASNLGDTVQNYWQDDYSPQLKAKMAARRADIDAAQGVAPKAWAAIKDTLSDPALAVETAASNAATFIPGAAAGRLAAGAKLASGMRAAQEFGPVGMAARGAIATEAGNLGTKAAIAGTALQQGADVSQSAYDSAIQQDDGVWAKNPQFMQAVQTAVDNGADVNDAITQMKHQFALSAGRATFVPATAVSVAANAIPGADLLERSLVGGGAIKAAAPGQSFGRLRAMGKAMLGEGAQEAIEEGGGQFFGNVAQRAYTDPNRDLGTDVGENAGMGAAGGMLFGVVGGAFHGHAPHDALTGHDIASPESAPVPPPIDVPPPAPVAPAPPLSPAEQAQAALQAQIAQAREAKEADLARVNSILGTNSDTWTQQHALYQKLEGLAQNGTIDTGTFTQQVANLTGDKPLDIQGTRSFLADLQKQQNDAAKAAQKAQADEEKAKAKQAAEADKAAKQKAEDLAITTKALADNAASAARGETEDLTGVTSNQTTPANPGAAQDSQAASDNGTGRSEPFKVNISQIPGIPTSLVAAANQGSNAVGNTAQAPIPIGPQKGKGALGTVRFGGTTVTAKTLHIDRLKRVLGLDDEGRISRPPMTYDEAAAAEGLTGKDARSTIAKSVGLFNLDEKKIGAILAGEGSSGMQQLAVGLDGQNEHAAQAEGHVADVNEDAGTTRLDSDDAGAQDMGSVGMPVHLLEGSNEDSATGTGFRVANSLAEAANGDKLLGDDRYQGVTLAPARVNPTNLDNKTAQVEADKLAKIAELEEKEKKSKLSPEEQQKLLAQEREQEAKNAAIIAENERLAAEAEAQEGEQDMRNPRVEQDARNEWNKNLEDHEVDSLDWAKLPKRLKAEFLNLYSQYDDGSLGSKEYNERYDNILDDARNPAPRPAGVSTNNSENSRKGPDEHGESRTGDRGTGTDAQGQTRVENAETSAPVSELGSASAPGATGETKPATKPKLQRAPKQEANRFDLGLNKPQEVRGADGVLRKFDARGFEVGGERKFWTAYANSETKNAVSGAANQTTEREAEHQNTAPIAVSIDVGNGHTLEIKDAELEARRLESKIDKLREFIKCLV